MFIFSEEKRRQLQEERPELSESELTRLLARMWNDLSEKKKVGPWRVWHQSPLGAARATSPCLQLGPHSLAPCVNHACAPEQEGGKLSAVVVLSLGEQLHGWGGVCRTLVLPLVSGGPALTSDGPAFLGGVNCNCLMGLARLLGVVHSHADAGCLSYRLNIRPERLL